jgi:hypothetical protein
MTFQSDKDRAFDTLAHLVIQTVMAVGFGVWQGSVGAGVFVFGVTLTVLYQVNNRRNQ